MDLPSIGSIKVGGQSGRAGVVVDARPLPGAADGDRLVALKVQSRHIRSDDATARAGGPPGPNAAGQTLSDLKAELAEAVRARDAARPSAARTPDRLSPQDRSIVESLRQRDAQVRQEENAHAGVAGDLAGPISYVYQRGPDGRQYAVGGSVQISAQAVTGDPAEARRIGGKLAAAALAATNPSAADISAANRAYRFGQADPQDVRDRNDSGGRQRSVIDQSA